MDITKLEHLKKTHQHLLIRLVASQIIVDLERTGNICSSSGSCDKTVAVGRGVADTAGE